jgi:hypothetical protein
MQLWTLGILEVDGEPFHPPSRTTADHTRDRISPCTLLTIMTGIDSSSGL